MQTNSPETATPRPSKGRGRPSYLPNDEHHKQVKLMAGFGIPQDLIAKCLGISTPTMRKHYRELLTVSAVEANTNVLRSLFQMATAHHNTAGAMFWAKD